MSNYICKYVYIQTAKLLERLWYLLLPNDCTQDTIIAWTKRQTGYENVLWDMRFHFTVLFYERYTYVHNIPIHDSWAAMRPLSNITFELGSRLLEKQ